jgi:hypothetical protein
MPKQGRAKLVSPDTRTENQALEIVEESSPQEQKDELVLSELDNEIECPRCSDLMELCSSFDKLVYSCESCSFLLKCV